MCSKKGEIAEEPSSYFNYQYLQSHQMQYVGRAIDSVSKTWSSINPATLSGAIDVIVVEHPDGNLACSPFHVRFGKFQILKPSQKKVQVIVNGQPTDIPMKLGDSGEAYFVFETKAGLDTIPHDLISSPVVSATSSPSSSPRGNSGSSSHLEEPDFLDIGNPAQNDDTIPKTPPSSLEKASTFEERARKLNEKLQEKKIPSKFDNNGDLLLDIEGYKPSKDKVHDTDEMLKQLLHDELGNEYDISSFVKEDSNGNMRIINPYEHINQQSPPGSPPIMSTDSLDTPNSSISEISTPTDTTTTTAELNSMASKPNATTTASGKNYIKTIRLTSEQLRCLDLKYGENDLSFSVDNSGAVVTAKLFLWRWDVPIVISDIDGTITKSDALGHVLTMIGKDWTHPGVAKLFTEIKRNGYNVMYLTARSAGQADSTRSYLRSIVQDGCKLPVGPVILSPDRTMAALRREVILKKPEVFKIACLNDLRKLYFGDLNYDDDEEKDELPTPFIAGFGNRITDALSYRTVGIPSSRIFTINPEGEVHMELLELAGYRSSYLHINELVDHFFPPVRQIYLGNNDDLKSQSPTPGSPVGTAMEERSFYRPKDGQFSDVNFWREPVLSIEDISDISSDDGSYNSPQTADDNGNRTRTPLENDDVKSSKSASVPIDYPRTPTSMSKIANDGIALDNTSKDIGKQIYLELGSPISSPRLSYVDKGLTQKMDHLSIASSAKPSTQVSKLNVFDDDHNKIPLHNSSGAPASEFDHEGGEDYEDDEFDEDEFDDDGEDNDDEFDEDEFES